MPLYTFQVNAFTCYGNEIQALLITSFIISTLHSKTAMKALQDEVDLKLVKKVEKENAQLGVIVLESIIEFESEIGLFGASSSRRQVH